MAIAMWLIKKKFMRIIYGLELIESIIWLMMRFDDSSMAYHLVGTHDRGTVSTLTVSRSSSPFIMLGCHYILLDVTGELWDPQVSSRWSMTFDG